MLIVLWDLICSIWGEDPEGVERIHGIGKTVGGGHEWVSGIVCTSSQVLESSRIQPNSMTSAESLVT
jgi:hypothetical protein